ncbi:MAG: hypothetical protein AAF416_16935 [Pseudomonadota bacterium]
MQMRATIIALVLLAAPAGAESRLSGDDIRTVLTGHWVSYDNARQHFLADGTTRYFAPDESLGFWRVDRDQYCSRWPPADGWTCYDVLRNTDGDLIWVDPEGGRTTGRPEAP